MGDAVRERVEEHLDDCDACRRLVAEAARGRVETAETMVETPEIAETVAAVDDTAETVADTAESGSDRRNRDAARGARGRKLAPGAVVDRYVIERGIGEGGMGQVLLADDPELKRKVVIKLLHPHLVDPNDSHGTRSRLMREAQAMAQVSHPNVVPVHDAGAFGDEVFIAMEFIDGHNLADWLRDHRGAAWREVLEIYLKAGRGLAAAHRAGLVHRDFKPHNVLVSRAGAVKVTDFGLARAELPAPKPGARLSRERKAVTPQSLLDSPLTSTGAIIGTPAYMAPEQMAGEFVDQRSDQFSFCVALFEGLFGKRPFAGGTSTEIFEAALEGKIEPMDPKSPVPRSIRSAITRGLAADAADRYGSMEELLSALAPRASRLTRWLTAGLAVAAVAGATIAVAVTGSSSDRPAGLCRGGASEIAGVWNPERAGAIETAFATTALTEAGPAARVVIDRLDAYSKGWAGMHKDACEATRVRGDQTDADMATRMACLSRLSSKLDSLIDVFENADTALVQSALDMLESLDAVALCADASGLEELEQLPDDPRARTGALAAWADVDRASVLMRAQRLDAAKQAVEPALESARKTSYHPLEAEALVILGELAAHAGRWKESESRLHEAVQAAEQGGHDVIKARAYLLLVDVATIQGNAAAGKQWAGYARATIERTGGNPIHGSTLAMRLSELHALDGNVEQAVAEAKRAAQIRERALGTDSELTAQAVRFVGETLAHKANDFVAALPHYERALELQTAIYGENHPEVASTMGLIAYALERTSKPEKAIEMSLRAIAINEAYFGEGSDQMATGYTGLIQGLLALERYDEAATYAKKSIEFKEKNLDPDHVYLASDLTMLGVVYLRAKRFDEAAAQFERALQISRKANGEETEEFVLYANAVAAARVKQERYGDALILLEHNLEILARIQSETSPLYIDTVTRVGDALTRAGKAADAVKRLTVAHARRSDPGHSASQQAWTAMELAEALWDSGQDKRAAREMATRAGELYTAASDVAGQQEATDWLAAHPGK